MMKNIFSKKFKLGRLTIAIFSNEIVVVFLGKKNTTIKTIKRLTPVRFNRVLFSCLVTVILFTVAFTFFSWGDKDSVIEDEKLKNNLLQSTETDYSNPDNFEKVTIRKHKVVKGETLSEIAKKYGVSIDTICGSSNLRSYDLIREGAVLSIPSRDGILYKVRKGNKIVSIAKKYRVSLKKILAQNKIKNFDFIPVGKTLFIPDAKPQNIFPGFLWPTRIRRITCGYGWRRNPFNRRHREFHPGLDIRARYTWIRSTRYGKVTYTGWMGGYGKTIIVAHPGGYKSLYGHLSRIIVRKGQYVKQGQNIGKSGNTGRSTGAHLHFEVIKNGRHKNPYTYLKRR